MTGTARSLCSLTLIAGILLCSPSAGAQGDGMAEVQVQMAEARRHFDALTYEQAVPALDRVVAVLSTRRSDDTRQILSEAYELRARARFGLGDQAGTQDDFTALLRLNPGYVLTGQISPRVVAIFETVKKANVTTVTLVVRPPTADIRLDGAPVRANAPVPVLIGEHTLTATQFGYRAGSATFTALAGTATEATLELPRTSAVLSVVTSPADVEVLIDGVSRGRTTAGPPPASFSDRATRVGIPVASLSSALVLGDIGTGAHRVEFRRGCYVQAERRIDVPRLEDISLDPIKLDPAVGTVSVPASQPNLTVIIDGQDKGAAPHAAELCEGEHTVEIRSPLGRYARRLDVRPGQRIEVTGTLRPAFALVSAGAQGPLNTDLRTAVERALEPVKGVYVFAPPADRLEQTLRASQLPPDWLSFDMNKRPLGVTGDITTPMRRDLSARLAKAFDAQGIASVAVPTAANRNRVVVSLLGAGSAEPDVVELSLDRPETITDAVAQLDRPVTFLKPSVGLSTIDVADLPGAIVVGVDAGGPAAQSGLQPGDVILKVGTQAVSSSADLLAALSARAANDTLAIEAKDKAGAAKRADLKVVMTPRVVGPNDQMMPANRLLAQFRTRLASPASAAEEAIIRLNIAAALARLQFWNEAKAELLRVKLPEGPGVGNGTVQYLLGLCADALGSRAEAEQAWRIAASSASWLTEDGPPVKELAEARIADTQRRPAGGR